MNAIVAIGGAALFRVVSAYRALVPSAVWILGLKTPFDVNDPQLRSLESLLEPFMDEYFAREAQGKVAAMSARLTAHVVPAAELDPVRVAEAVATLARALASAMALVEMLDRACATQAVELVVTDDSTVLAHTAAAWARARGLPVVSVAGSATLRRPSLPYADRTIVVGERTRRAYLALDVDESLLAVLPSDSSSCAIAPDERVSRRTQAKAAFTRALGWAATDVLVVFVPAERSPVSALEPGDGFGASLAAMFESIAIARATLPSLRLAVADQPAVDGNALAANAAAKAGLAASDYAYTQSDHDVWIAGADIVVSVESTRSIEAAALRIPAINLWRPANWYLGPGFAAEDGVIDASPQTLGGALVALARDANLRAQIASIACDRIAGDAQASAAIIAATSAQLVKLRRPVVTIARKSKPDIVLWAPDYAHSSGGIRALFRLCHLINLAGGNASMHTATKLHSTWNTPRRESPFTDRTIVLVPEIVFVDPSVERVVRWVLNKPGLLGGPSTYGPNEMVFFYAPAFRAAAQAATAEVLTDDRELEVFTTEPELFFNDRSRARLYDCLYVGKGEQLYRRLQTIEMRDALVIERFWPASRDETASLLRGCRRFYSFDANTAITVEATICGAQAFTVLESGELYEQNADMPDPVQRYYDLSQVERFLRLVGERWK